MNMAYNQNLAQRMRERLRETPALEEKKMFGGVGFLVQGNMACGVHGDAMIVRVGSENYAEALSHPHTQPFDMTGRPMTGWIEVLEEGYLTDQDLTDWVGKGVRFAQSLPPK
jgi:TfoX/Sxy family transcriptional regulator of competence genes